VYFWGEKKEINHIMRSLFTLLSIFVITFTSFAQVPSDMDNIKMEIQNRIEKSTGKPFSSFQAEAVDGVSYSQSNLIGKITIINFWFELCAPCVAELDALNKLYNTFAANPKFQFISFSVDAPELARESIKRYNLLYPVISISHEECYRLNCNLGFPTTIIVDERGNMVFIKPGGHIEKQAVEEDIDKIARIIQENINK